MPSRVENLGRDPHELLLEVPELGAGRRRRMGAVQRAQVLVDDRGFLGDLGPRRRAGLSRSALDDGDTESHAAVLPTARKGPAKAWSAGMVGGRPGEDPLESACGGGS